MNLASLPFLIVDYAIFAVQITIFLYVLMSWFPQFRESRFGDTLHIMVTPVLSPFKILLDKIFKGKNFMLDFSPILALLTLNFIRQTIKSIASSLTY